MEKIGVEKIEAFAESLKELAILGKKISEDKKVNLEDLPLVIGFIPKLPEVLEGFKGLGKAIDEGKDIDVSEAVLLIQKIHQKVKEVEQA